MTKRCAGLIGATIAACALSARCWYGVSQHAHYGSAAHSDSQGRLLIPESGCSNQGSSSLSQDKIREILAHNQMLLAEEDK